MKTDHGERVPRKHKITAEELERRRAQTQAARYIWKATRAARLFFGVDPQTGRPLETATSNHGQEPQGY